MEDYSWLMEDSIWWMGAVFGVRKAVMNGGKAVTGDGKQYLVSTQEWSAYGRKFSCCTEARTW